jgi:hypothetical protein
VGSRYLTDLAEVLRIAGLQVVELDGWQTRARGSGGYDGLPWAVLWHHTASAGNGAADADYCTFGSDDAPVCNLVIGRDGLVYVCAAGATNTNGKGGPLTLPDGRVIPTDGCNSRVVGIEFSNDGVGMAWPEVQVSAGLDASAAICAAYIGGADQVAQHVDWAPDRKIDPARAEAVQGPWRPTSTNSSGSWRLADLRAECLRRTGSLPPTPVPEPEPQPPEDGDDVKLYLVLDPNDGATQYVTDMATFRTPISNAGAAAEGVSMFGWQPFADGTADPYPLGPGWADFLGRLPVTQP